MVRSVVPPSLPGDDVVPVSECWRQAAAGEPTTAITNSHQPALIAGEETFGPAQLNGHRLGVEQDARDGGVATDPVHCWPGDNRGLFGESQLRPSTW